MELTQETVDSALYEGRSRMSKSGRKTWTQWVLWDDGLPGFGLRITPRNRKSFIVKYRAKGRRRTKTLGAAGRLKLEEARRKAAEFLASVAEEQPEAKAGAAKVAGVETVAQLADAYLEQYLKSHVPSWYADQRLIRIHIKPAIGRAPVAEVSQTDLTNLRRRVGKRFPADARRLEKLLKGMFDWAAEGGLWSKSPRAAAAASSTGAVGGEPEPAAEAAPPPDAAGLEERLERSQSERRALEERLEEVSASGSEMLTRLGEQAAALRELESELARARRELNRVRKAGEGRPDPQEAGQRMDTLRQSVEQLMASLRESRSEGRGLAEKLSRAETHGRTRGDKTAALVRRRNELEARLREQECRIAALTARRRRGRWRVGLWLAAGALGGVLLTFVALRALASERAAGAVPTEGPVAAAPAPGVSPAPAEGAAADPAPAPDLEPPAAGGVAGGVIGEPAEDSAAGSAGSADADPPDQAAAEAAVRAWAAAWSEQRADDYLAAYAQRFVPPDGLGRREWASLRRERIERPASIRLTLDNLRRTALAGDRVRVDFEQRYETATYSDTVRKSLELVWEDGSWRIAAERSD